MAKTRLAKKRRILRAREHQLKAKLLSFQGEPKQSEQQYLDAQQPDPRPGAAEPVEQPNRATCPSCGTRQKVRVSDGCFGKHRTTLASDPLEAVDCPGVGRRWDAA